MSTYGHAVENMSNEIWKLKESTDFLYRIADQEERMIIDLAKEHLYNAVIYFDTLKDTLLPERANIELS